MCKKLINIYVKAFMKNLCSVHENQIKIFIFEDILECNIVQKWMKFFVFPHQFQWQCSLRMDSFGEKSTQHVWNEMKMENRSGKVWIKILEITKSRYTRDVLSC